MRLAEVSTRAEATRFLARDLPLYNQRFSVQPAQPTDLHRPRPAGCDLDQILCLKTTRCLRKDCTIAHQGGLYQIHDTLRATHVLVEERIDGTMRINPQRPGARLSRHHVSSREGSYGQHGPPPPVPGHAEAGPSVAHTPAAGAKNTGPDGDAINRTFLLWEKEDISTLG